MDITFVALVLIIGLVGIILQYWFSARIKSGRSVELRPLPGYEAVNDQVSRAVETGQGIHFGLGRATLVGSASPTSLASWTALDYLAGLGCPKDVPPLVTVGDGTLLLAGQDSLRSAYQEAGKSSRYSPALAQFVAWEGSPMTYAAGVADLINRGELGSNILFGRFGPELAIMAESADRENMEQIIGTDDPESLALAAVYTDKLLIGEQLFAAGAYLQGDPARIAGAQVQDILRFVIIGALTVAAIVGLIIST